MSEEIPLDKPKKTFLPSLSDEEISFIKDKIQEGVWTDKQIAEKLGRAVVTVKKYRTERFGVKKGSRGKIKGNVVDHEANIEINEAQEERQIKKETKEKKQEHKKIFMSTNRGKKINALLSDADFAFFTDQWISYHMQFEDMTASEEDMLEKMILINIRMLGNQKSLKEVHTVQNKLRESLSGKEELDPENDKELQILQTIESYNGQEIELNKEFVILNKEYSAIQDSLNATRKQRESREKIGASTFLDLMKKWNQQEVKESQGRFNELMRKATEKKLIDLQKPHQYLDGSYDLPYLDGDAFRKMREIEKQKEERKKEIPNDVSQPKESPDNGS